MSKKKKKKDKSYNYEPYDESICKDMADHLEAYTDTLEKFCIVDGKPIRDVEEGIKRVRKAIKNLRNGHPEKEIDEEEWYRFWEKIHEAVAEDEEKRRLSTLE